MAEDLRGKDLEELIDIITMLEKTGYPINYQNIRTTIKEQEKTDGKKMGEEEKLKFYRMKIRHAQRKAVETNPRKEELEKIGLKPGTGEISLREIAGDYSNRGDAKIKAILAGYSKTKKEELIPKLLETEAYIAEHPESLSNIAVKKSSSSSPKKSSSKASPTSGLDALLDRVRNVESDEKKKKPKSKSCDEENDFTCGDNEVCDMTTNPGVCIDKKQGSAKPATLKWKGKTIVGSEKAIEALKLKLQKGVKSSEEKIVKSCGKYDYEELLEKRLDELKEILSKKKLDVSNLNDHGKAVDIVCNAFKHNEPCNEETDFACKDDRVCDMTTNPGICVDLGVASDEPKWLNYKGNTIVGSADAMKALKKRLGIDEKYVPDPDDEVRNKLLKKAKKRARGNGPNVDKLSSAQLTQYLEGSRIREGRKSKQIEDEEVIEKKDSDEEVIEEVIEEVKKKKSKEPVSDNEEEIDEEEKVKQRKKQETVDIAEVERVLANVVSGKKEQVEEYSKVQQMVFKCMGLISA